MFEEESIRRMWTKTHSLLTSALKIHPSYKKISRLLTLEQFLLHLGTQRTLYQELITGMFNTNNLNGALYLLHSHINHSCQPNSRTIDVKERLADLTGISPCGNV